MSPVTASYLVPGEQIISVETTGEQALRATVGLLQRLRGVYLVLLLLKAEHLHAMAKVMGHAECVIAMG